MLVQWTALCPPPPEVPRVVSLSSPYDEEDQGDSVAALFASSPVYCTVYTVANQSLRI